MVIDLSKPIDSEDIQPSQLHLRALIPNPMSSKTGYIDHTSWTDLLFDSVNVHSPEAFDDVVYFGLLMPVGTELPCSRWKC